ncbi:hypothetical protein AgCh_021181 [Apium graveolens]
MKFQTGADTTASWYSIYIVIVTLVLVSSIDGDLFREDHGGVTNASVGVDQLIPIGRICDEIYVVGEGETLHTISDKCKDPFIVEQNPHIQDPDDVFPGLVIKITPRI